MASTPQPDVALVPCPDVVDGGLLKSPDARADLRHKPFFRMSQPRQPPLHQQHQQTVSHRPMPAAPPGRRRTAQGNAPLLRRPGPPNHLTSAPAAATPHSGGGGRLRDISLASLLEGVDQVPSARKRLVPTSAGVLASGVSRPGVMQAKVPLR